MASTTDSTSSAEGAQTPTTMGSTPGSPGGEHEGDMFPPDNEISHLASPVVRVLVDTKPFTKEFFVHEHLICSRSEFFEKAVHGEWKESEERKVSLPEDEPSIFLTYLNILYAGHTLKEADSPEWERIMSQPCPSSDRHLRMCQVYVLAKKLMDNDTRDNILHRLTRLSYDCSIVCPSFEAVRAIYSGTPSGDDMRVALLRAYLNRAGSEELFENLAESHSNAARLPQEFLLDLTRDLFRINSKVEVLERLADRYDAVRDQKLDLSLRLQKLDTDHKETQARLESMTKAFEDMKAQCNDAKAKVKAKNEELMSKDQVIRDKDNNISYKAVEIRANDSTINSKDQTIKDKNQTIKKKDQVIQEGKVELARALQQAESYKLVMDKLLAATATKK